MPGITRHEAPLLLRGALNEVVDPAAFTAAAGDPKARAEQLSVEEWGRLVACDGALDRRHPEAR